MKEIIFKNFSRKYVFDQTTRFIRETLLTDEYISFIAQNVLIALDKKKTLLAKSREDAAKDSPALSAEELRREEINDENLMKALGIGTVVTYVAIINVLILVHCYPIKLLLLLLGCCIVVVGMLYCGCCYCLCR
jgi:hypothetical protein